MALMPIQRINDWETRIARYDAFWQNEIIDRPPVYIQVQKTDFELCDLRRWKDAEYIACTKAKIVDSFDYYGDALPSCTPNVGPDFFAAMYGAKIEFEKTTSFMKHSLESIKDFLLLQFELTGEYFEAVEKMYELLFKLGKDKFYVGWPDIHPGADCLVGLRGPAELCMDIIDEPEIIKKSIAKTTKDFVGCFDYYYNKLVVRNQAVTGWPLIFSTKKWHVPSNDFSYMISEKDFSELFLNGLEDECTHMEASLFHLDGPGSLTQLDKLLSIKKLNAVQWVYGAGNGTAKDWIHIYKKIQTAGKGIQVFAYLEDLDSLFASLKPEGIAIVVYGVKDHETAAHVINRVKKWA
jgi:hypothetical protein